MLTVDQVKMAHCWRCRANRRHVNAACESCGNRRIIEQPIPAPTPIQERFWSNVKQTPFCWNWIRPDDGRGCFIVAIGPRGKSRGYRAQVLSWYIHTGCMPKGMILRMCLNERCVNPEHLAEGNYKDGAALRARRGTQSRILERCRNGHPYTPENTIPPKPFRPYRKCRICYRANEARYWERRRAAGGRKGETIEQWKKRTRNPT